jgi:hypothetical protein
VVHLRMSRIFLGETTIEETLKEIAKEKPTPKSE